MKFLCLAVLLVASQAGPVVGPTLDNDLYYQEEVTRMRQDPKWAKSFKEMQERSICDLCEYGWNKLKPFFAEYSKIYYKDGMLDEVFLGKDGLDDLYYLFLECRDTLTRQYPGTKDIDHMIDIEKCYFRQKLKCTTM